MQHLRNSLAARVYEAHARSCLEYGDLAEFNQCQVRCWHTHTCAFVRVWWWWWGVRAFLEQRHSWPSGDLSW